MTLTDTQIRVAAEHVAWSIGQGGFILYRKADLSGGEWYSSESRSTYDPTKTIRIAVPNRGVRGSVAAINTIASTIRDALAKTNEYRPIYRHSPPRPGETPIGWVR